MSWDSGFAVDLPNKVVATDTMLNPKQTEPRHVVVARVGEQLAHVYEQIPRVDEEIARAEEQLSKRDDAARHLRIIRGPACTRLVLLSRATGRRLAGGRYAPSLA